MIKWGRSKGGFVGSKCGRFEISICRYKYILTDNYNEICIGEFEYQAEAKNKAEKTVSE